MEAIQNFSLHALANTFVDLLAAFVLGAAIGLAIWGTL